MDCINYLNAMPFSFVPQINSAANKLEKPFLLGFPFNTTIFISLSSPTIDYTYPLYSLIQLQYIKKHVDSTKGTTCFLLSINHLVNSTFRQFLQQTSFRRLFRHKKSGSRNRCLNSSNSWKSLVFYALSVRYFSILDICQIPLENISKKPSYPKMQGQSYS